MENLDLAKFVPEKAVLTELATRYAGLTINGVDDTAGYTIVDEARKDLKKKRVMIKNTGKELRQEALAFQKKVIAIEKELIEIIEPLELELKAKQDAIDEQKSKALRMAALPARKEKLASINALIPDDHILGMSAEEFTEYYNARYADFLTAREKAIKEAEEKLSREKELEAAKEQARLKAEEAAKVEADRVAKEAADREARLKVEAEEAKIRAVKEAEEKAEAEKRAIVEEQQKKEQARLKAEADAKKAAEDKALAEEIEQKRLEKKKKYQKFLSDNGYDGEGSGNFYLGKTETEVVLYKKIATFTL